MQRKIHRYNTYFASSKFSKSLVYRKNFSFIWQVVFKLGYVFCEERLDTSFEFEQTRIKVANDNNSRCICKKVKSLWPAVFGKHFSMAKIQSTFIWHIPLLIFWSSLGQLQYIFSASSSKRNISHHSKEIFHANTKLIVKKPNMK